MPRSVVVTEIRAPIERCFDLARSIDFHVVSQSGAKERAVAGTTSASSGSSSTATCAP